MCNDTAAGPTKESEPEYRRRLEAQKRAHYANAPAPDASMSIGGGVMGEAKQPTTLDRAWRVVNDHQYQQGRAQRAARFIELASSHPEVAEMIELSRNL